MTDLQETTTLEQPAAIRRPFRRAVLHGLGVVLPPLLTIVVFLWAWNLISAYVLVPIEGAARTVIVANLWDVRTQKPEGSAVNAYQLLSTGEWLPRHIYDAVKAKPGPLLPQTAQGYFERYVDITWLRRSTVVPLFLVVFVLVMYLLGKFFGAGIGRWIWGLFEALVDHLPLIRNVYSSVKQVTDFVFNERRIGFNRVVAVEYPRQGIWAVAFVTGEGMLDVRAAANEPVLNLLVPTSPIPGTGFTVVVRKSEVLDLNMTVDQAIQYLVSCGVVVPPQQQIREDIGYRMAAEFAAAAQKRTSQPEPSGIEPARLTPCPSPNHE
jgi:uncharacterized membrane protein